MSDAAQGELPGHEVFTTPFKVEPQYEQWKTPSNYKEQGETAATIKVWRVQNTGKEYGSVATRGPGIDDSPDAEMLTEGFNIAKGRHDAGVIRHGNYLQWGFCGSPSQMTPAGKAFFLNCIAYIHKFDGKGPLIRQKSSDRSAAAGYARAIPRIKDPSFLNHVMGPQLRTKYDGNAEALAKLFEANVEYLYRASGDGWEVDEELKGLGLPSNRKVETLEKLVALREVPEKKDIAEKLIARYLDAKTATPEKAKAWLESNRGRIFFSDVGGYQFFAVPEGYLPVPAK